MKTDIEEILHKLNEWFKDKNKLVIAIDGYSGVGKTTILEEIAKANKNVLAIYLDDFILTGKEREKSLLKSKDKPNVFELNWYDYKKVKDLVGKFRNNTGIYSTKIYDPKTDSYDKNKEFDLSKKILIIEGVFLLHSELFKNTWDKTIYLKTDFKKADERRIIREKKKWGKDYYPEDKDGSFTKLFKIAYRNYISKYNPEKSADLIIKI